MKSWMYILKCNNHTYYIGSTNNLELRLKQHQAGEGANFTRKHLPVELIYLEEFYRIDLAYLRECQIKKWSRAKKEALIRGDLKSLKKLSKNRQNKTDG